jgi:hypothetical protein
MRHLPKTIGNQDFEMPLINTDNKELLQMWYQLDGLAEPLCYGFQATASHISRSNVLNEIYIFIPNRDN